MKTVIGNFAGAGLPSLGVRRPWLVAVINLLIAIAGIVAITAIEVRELPDVDQPIVNVRANLPGASPETMDAEVTRILEGAVARVSGVKEVNSNSEEALLELPPSLPPVLMSTVPLTCERLSVGCSGSYPIP